MKSPNSSPRSSNQNGFSLIATVTMMVLLSLIAVGLLSLSATVLRSSTADQAQLEARANARLALQLAIGQLQRAAGPDQRITAPASLLNQSDPSAVTGVWESLKLDPNGGQDLASLKSQSQAGLDPNGEFVTWLNSDSYGQTSDPAKPIDRNASQEVRLLSTPGGLGNNEVTARVLSVGNGEGGVAWATIDESVKARFNLPETENLANLGDTERNVMRDRLRNPERASTETIDVVGRIPTEKEAAKIASFEQGPLFSGTTPEQFREYFNDITPWSLGVISNPVEGGLKKDLTVAFEGNNDPTAGDFIYTQSNEQLAKGEPYMSTLREYYRLYKTNNNATTPMEASIPDGYSPFTRDRRTREYVPDPVPVDGQVLAPVVSRVNVVFSLIGRQAHGNWLTTIPNQTGDPRRNQMVYLIYTPVVTLYNPYTKPITVDNLEVSFKHLPLAFRFFRNGAPQNLRPALLSQMHIQSENRTDWEDSFSCTLSETASNSRATPVTLSPGESRVFGLNHPAGSTWSSMLNYLWTAGSLADSKTIDITTGQGYNQGNSGFVVDWLIPNASGKAADAKTGTFGVRTTDTVNVEFTPKVPTDSRGAPMTNFSVNISAKVNGGSRPQQIGAYRYTYGSEDRLKEAFEEGEHPELGAITYPYTREKAWNFNELYQTNIENTPIEDWTGPKQFAVFSMATRTAHDSLYPTRPGLDTSFVHNVLDMDITSAHPAQMPMEISFLPVISSPGSTNNVGSVEVWSKDDPRTFFFSGWTVDKGFTNYPSIEVPRTPITNLAQFRNANLASSGHLPMPAQTVGDSHAHPLIPSDRAIGNDSSFNYSTLDHAWLANNVLYDNFYLSGMRDSDEFERFLNGEKIPYNSRSEVHIPANQDVQSAVELYRDGTGWTSTAAFQLTKGAFNVNSTSVEAWKALLKSNLEALIPTVDPVTLKDDSVLSAEAAFPRILDGPTGAIDASAPFIENQVRWTGFRDLDEREIEELAEAIVENVRLRGPFTSMSEFLNRHLDRSGENMSLRGALQQAIEDAGLNSQLTSDRIVSQNNARDFEYPNPEAAVGDTEAASAAFLTQSDLMGVIGNSLTVRGDTFVVRAYGDSKNKAGKIVATATCEAVVQRLPDFVDPQDQLGAKPKDFAKGDDVAMKSEINEKFGRRFVVRSFRWLSREEV